MMRLSLGKRTIDFAVMAGSIIASIFISLWFKTNVLVSTLLFYGVPTIYFTLRLKGRRLKILLFSLSFTIPLWIFADFVETLNHAWFIPVSVFPRVMGVFAIEDLIWGAFSAYLTVALYESFSNEGVREVIDRKMEYLLIPSLISLAVLVPIEWLYPEIFIFPNSYFILGSVFLLLPSLAIAAAFPRILKKFLLVEGCLVLITCSFELMAVYLDQWVYPGAYFVPPLRVFNKALPWEEIFFCFFVAPFLTLAVYEFFDDDRK